MKKYILALDQGTTSSRAILFDKASRIVSSVQREFTQFYPKEGWVEHDPLEIWNTQSAVMREAVEKAGAKPSEIAAVGITNQRETTVVWNKKTGKPIHNAIVWQCRRTASLCDQLKAEGLETYIKEATGLVVDAYFSGTKVKMDFGQRDRGPSPRRAGRDSLRNDRHLASLEPYERRGPRNGLLQRLPDHALQYSDLKLG